MERQEKIDNLKNLIKSSDVELGLDSSYTLEQFELDFENASNIEAKHEALIKALDNFDPYDPIVKETLLKHREELKDLRTDLAVEEDIRCNKDIDNGEVELYTCIKESDGYTVGHNYYVKIDDVKSMLSDKWSDVGTDEMKDKIGSMKPLIWIYSDDGIGTLKKKNLFGILTDKVFSEYFVKFENK